MSNISTLTVTSADNSKATENAAFARMEEEKTIDVDLPIFSLYKHIHRRTDDSTDWGIHASHIIQPNAVTFLDSLKRIWVSLALLSQPDFGLTTDRSEGYEKEGKGNCLAMCQVLG